jgi:tetratricopeptide (TPR) repeat protein
MIRPHLTRRALIELGVTLSMGIISIFTIISGVKRWFYRYYLEKALLEHDTRRIQRVAHNLKKAISWRKDLYHPKFLLAKIKAEQGNLQEAERIYTQILEKSPDSTIKRYARLGLGILYLKASSEETLRKVFLRKAQEEFSKVLEEDPYSSQAQLGLIYRAIIERNLKDLQLRLKRFTLPEGASQGFLMDYYMAKGFLSLREDNFIQAERFFKKVYQYEPSWSLPFANMLLSKARFYLSQEIPQKELLKHKEALQSIFKDLRQKSRGFKERIMQALIGLRISASYRFASKKPRFALELLGRALHSFKDKFEVAFTNLVINLIFLKQEKEKEHRLAYEKRFVLEGKTLLDRDFPEENLKAILMNNICVCMEDLVSAGRKGFSRNEAISLLKGALQIKPQEYVYNRNMAILLKIVKDKRAKGLTRTSEEKKDIKRLERLFR